MELDRQFPPGPEEPVELNYTSDILEKITSLYHNYGKIFKAYSPSRKAFTYVLTEPEYVKHVLSTNNKNYLKGVGNEIVKMLLGNGIIVSEGEHWKKQRRMIQPAFHRDVIRAMSERMCKINLGILNKLEEAAKNRNVVNITSEMSKLALDIILECLFSTDLQWLKDDLGTNPFDIIHNETGRDLLFARKFRNLTREVTRIIERREQEDRIEMDFLSMFMEAEDKVTGMKMTHKDLLDEVMTLIVAAHETTAGTLNWAWFHITNDKQVEQQLFEESLKLVTDTPSFEDLPNLSYALNVAQEALRMYPPVWIITRRAIANDKLDTFFVPGGTDMFLCPFLTHRDPDLWDEPLSFNPDRFNDDGINKKRHRFAFYPFSGGPRRCIGDYFALVEMQIHLSSVIKKCSFTLDPDNMPIELEPQINLRTKYPIHLFPEWR